VIAGKPVSERDNFIRFPALAYSKPDKWGAGFRGDALRYPLQELEETKFPENALMEVDPIYRDDDLSAFI
jgi:hypothetical protein